VAVLCYVVFFHLWITKPIRIENVRRQIHTDRIGRSNSVTVERGCIAGINSVIGEKLHLIIVGVMGVMVKSLVETGDGLG